MPLDPVIAKTLAQSMLGLSAPESNPDQTLQQHSVGGVEASLTQSPDQTNQAIAQDAPTGRNYLSELLARSRQGLKPLQGPLSPQEQQNKTAITYYQKQRQDEMAAQAQAAQPAANTDKNVAEAHEPVEPGLPGLTPEQQKQQLAQGGALGASAQGDALTDEQRQQRANDHEIALRDQLAEYMEHAPQMSTESAAGNQMQAIGNQLSLRAERTRGDFSQAAEEEKKAVALKAREVQAEEKTNAPIVDAYAKTMHERYEQLDQAGQEARAQTQVAIANYQKTQDEMRKMALENPKDLFGQAGANKVLGTIAMVLGGFSSTLSGGPNQGFQIIQARANQNIMAQQRRFQQLQQLGENDKSLYGMIHERLQDTTATSKALENLALETYKAQLQTTANQYAPQKAQAFVADEIAKIDQAQAKNNADVDAHYNAAAAQQMRALGKQVAVESKQQADQIKQWQSRQEQSLEGFVGWVPAKEHQKYAQIVGGARDMVAIGDEMKELLKAGWSIADIREATINDARFFRAAKAWIDTGTRIEEGEQKTIDAFKSNNMERFFTAVFGTDINKLSEKITASQAGITHSTIKYVRAAAPNTIVFDNRDSLWGRFDPRTHKTFAREQLEKMHGTEKGQSVLKNAPAYMPAYEG